MMHGAMCMRSQVDGFPPYTSEPVALIATAEKGYYSTKVSAATMHHLLVLLACWALAGGCTC